ncbi:MAG TPA: sterol desaturase family protein [Vicinamibacterales bacterium]|jgi:sterol desaturase/sphingolipid hydroxylase (fatty acid hydroxylase superfamily)
MLHSLFETLRSLFAHMSMVERVSLAAIGSGAVLLALLERIVPYTKDQAFLREGFFDDFALYTIAQNYVLSIVIFSIIIARLDDAGGFSRLQLLAHWPLWLQVTLFVVTHDFYIYWMHRWQHRNRLMWRLHEAHHSPKAVDWLSGSRSHCLEILINQTVEFAPIVLLGASPAVIPLKGAISAVWGMYIHSNLNVHTGRLQWIINGPEMHRWHHTMGKGMRSNFSTKLAIWDWMFGTAYCPPGEQAKEYGVRSWFPKHYIGQTLYAFRVFHTRARSSAAVATSRARDSDGASAGNL